MRTTIDKAGRVVIPAAVRERAGLAPGTALEVTVDELGIRLERVAAGPAAGQGWAPPGRAPDGRRRRPPGARHRRARRRGAESMAVDVFLDTSVLLAGLVDFGPQSAPAQSVMHAVAEKIVPAPATAWHCCLEFYSVATRLPAEFRLAPADAVQLVQEEIFGRMTVHDLPAGDRLAFLRTAGQDASPAAASTTRTSPKSPAPLAPASSSPTTAVIFCRTPLRHPRRNTLGVPRRAQVSPLSSRRRRSYILDVSPLTAARRLTWYVRQPHIGGSEHVPQSVCLVLVGLTLSHVAVSADTPGPPPSTSQARTGSSTKRVVWTLVGIGAGFGAGLLIGLNAFDDAINSDRKVWTSALVGAAAGGLAGGLLSKNVGRAPSAAAMPKERNVEMRFSPSTSRLRGRPG